MRLDAEDLVRFLLGKGFNEDQLKLLVAFLASLRKGTDEETSLRLSNGIVEDVLASLPSLSEFKPKELGVRAGEGGLGSRGTGDQEIHEALTTLSAPGDAYVLGELVLAADGFHSRLSQVPLLMGFHATRAAMRDVMVSGGVPLATLVDVHVADDTDVSHVLDVSVGAKVAAEGCGAAFAGGSTLRIGGDVVWGSRVTGGSFAVGKRVREWSRFAASPGDRLCATVGKGGGTVTAIALHYSMEDLARLTLNLDFCNEIKEAFKLDYVKGAFDWTNGGIVLDAYEIAKALGVRVDLTEDVYRAVHPLLLRRLEELNLDPLTLSVDAIVFIGSACPPGTVEVGKISRGSGVYLNGKSVEPEFREAPYTRAKRAVEAIKKGISGELLTNYLKEREEMLRRMIKRSW